MTAVMLGEPYDVRTLLLGAERPVEALADSLHDQGVAEVLRGLGAPVGQAVERETAKVVNGFLGLDLVDLLAGGWSRYADLRAAARRTRDGPATTEVVAMATHQIESHHRPTVELFVDGLSVGTVLVDLAVIFDLEGLVAVVRRARLVEVHTGYCTVTATLGLEGVQVISRQGRLDLPGAVRLRGGIPLLAEARTSADQERAAPGE